MASRTDYEQTIIYDEREIYASLVNNTRLASNEILIAGTSKKSMTSSLDFLEEMQTLDSRTRSNMIVKMIIPPIESGERLLFEKKLQGIDWQESESAGVAFVVYDKSKAILFDPSDLSDSVDSETSALVTTNKQTVRALSLIFEAFWNDNKRTGELKKNRSHEQQITTQSRLLQDILAHDIRNYNQIIELAAELLADILEGNPKADVPLASLRKAIEGSTELLEKTKKLGKVLAQENPKLTPTNLVLSIERSIALVKDSNAEKDINVNQFDIPVAVGASVLADDLIDEIFTNLFLNSVKYTEGNDVNIKVKIDHVIEHPKLQQRSPIQQINDSISSGVLHSPYWKVSISDEGKGIPDETKSKVFARYLDRARGTGLGMSIVHALVIERYKGKVTLRNRISEDYTRGTIIEIWLPEAAKSEI